MSELHIECPHCGASFNVQIDGEISNMMVFPCARCKAPLMYLHGEICELDKEEYAGLREKLSRVLNAVQKQDSSMGEIAESLRKMVESSDAIAAGREETISVPDDFLDQLKKDLDEMDVDTFIQSH